LRLSFDATKRKLLAQVRTKEAEKDPNLRKAQIPLEYQFTNDNEPSDIGQLRIILMLMKMVVVEAVMVVLVVR
jgi:hypothetical protein